MKAAFSLLKWAYILFAMMAVLFMIIPTARRGADADHRSQYVAIHLITTNNDVHELLVGVQILHFHIPAESRGSVGEVWEAVKAFAAGLVDGPQAPEPMVYLHKKGRLLHQ